MEQGIKISVAQLGSRMHYAVPHILNDAGLLGTFYTDICSNKFPFTLLNSKFIKSSAVKRFNTRIVRIVGDKIVHFPYFGIKYFRTKAKAPNLEAEYNVFNWAGKTFNNLVNTKKWFNYCDAIYVFNSAALEIVIKAKEHKKTVILEQCSLPTTIYFRLVQNENRQYPEWGDTTWANFQESPIFQEYFDRERQEWALADIILAPSEFVKKCLITEGVTGEKIKVVQYGVDFKQIKKVSPKAHSNKLNVLCVGYVELRKGVHHFYNVAKNYSDANFRFVGSYDKLSADILSELKNYVTLTGHVDKKSIVEHFEWADVFMLLSIGEGSATVTYEALAQGKPVITTEAAGSIVEHGKSGFIVDGNDTESIMGYLDLLKNDEKIYTQMSIAAAERSVFGNTNSYKKRLMSELSNI